MMKDWIKLRNIWRYRHPWQYLRAITEIHYNRLFIHKRPVDAVPFEHFLEIVPDAQLQELLKSGGEAEAAVTRVRFFFLKRLANLGHLPFPLVYSADKVLAMLAYALVRRFQPSLVLETGVGYGITSALILDAISSNQRGQLISIDLPPLGDPDGQSIGLAVPLERRTHWKLYLGSSRYWLPRCVARLEQIDMFLHDSANVFTLQRWEWHQVAPSLAPRGIALFNSVSPAFAEMMLKEKSVKCFHVHNLEKKGHVVGLYIKALDVKEA